MPCVHQQLSWQDERKAAEVQRSLARRAVLELNPLTERYYETITRNDKSAGYRALTKVKEMMFRTMSHPLEDVVCAFDTPRPALQDLAIKGLHLSDGRKHRNFWPNLDLWFDGKAKELGDDWQGPLWQRYLDETFDREYDLSFPDIGHLPLLTWLPMDAGALIDLKGL
ncbi:hypothetical protein B0H15DRAFT_928616 [Mycena belliarum]|uniref:Uncharacterized protein n=1 Tax=Mycena belliarum TaxID=1033014 RepID=A0AAD6UBM8_9AGAR|nr:hypothetical protein B0H15DRAFT_928616 [Mycena belliae]